MRVKCLAQEHNTMSLARAQTWITQPRDERTNNEACTTILCVFVKIMSLKHFSLNCLI